MVQNVVHTITLTPRGRLVRIFQVFLRNLSSLYRACGHFLLVLFIYFQTSTKVDRGGPEGRNLRFPISFVSKAVCFTLFAIKPTAHVVNRRVLESLTTGKFLKVLFGGSGGPRPWAEREPRSEAGGIKTFFCKFIGQFNSTGPVGGNPGSLSHFRRWQAEAKNDPERMGLEALEDFIHLIGHHRVKDWAAIVK